MHVSQDFHRETKLRSLFQFSCILSTRLFWFKGPKILLYFFPATRTNTLKCTNTFNIFTMYANTYILCNQRELLFVLLELYAVRCRGWVKCLLTSKLNMKVPRYQCTNHHISRNSELTWLKPECATVAAAATPSHHIRSAFCCESLGTTAANVCMEIFYIFNIQGTSNKSKATCLFLDFSNSGWIFLEVFPLSLLTGNATFSQILPCKHAFATKSVTATAHHRLILLFAWRFHFLILLFVFILFSIKCSSFNPRFCTMCEVKLKLNKSKSAATQTDGYVRLPMKQKIYIRVPQRQRSKITKEDMM